LLNKMVHILSEVGPSKELINLLERGQGARMSSKTTVV
jgi:hypothetical protein